MNERSPVILELPKVLERLGAHTGFSASHDLALGLQPSYDCGAVRRALGATSEARRLLDLKPATGVRGARDVRPLARRARMGGSLEPAQFLEVLDTLRAARFLRGAIAALADQFPVLSGFATQIVDCSRLEREIAGCIGEQGDLLDEASPALARTRGAIRSERERLLARLGEIVNSSAYRPMLQEAIVTQRDGRYVVPVKAEYKSRFRGVVHDQSASGATLFIEPLATVESNNRIRQLELAEQHEIERILRELSTLLAASADAVAGNVAALAEIDLALAKAKLAGLTNASEPEIVMPDDPAAQPAVLLREARHPLLEGNVVPISVHLGGDFRALVITGPNTGGKTVTLKTVGLLVLMAQCGLHVPAAEGSRIAAFHEIFADIGDEQSIEQNLSTFSSHLRNVGRVLDRADERSLVLLDELGAGTDPAEGSALAQAILDHLLQRGALVIATTHYSELKAYAHLTPGAENASVEFDLATLAPTYHLCIGVPGPSNALAIASRLAIPATIIDAARQKMNPDELAVERLLSELRAERERAIAERWAAEDLARDAAGTRAKLADQLASLQRERGALLAAARDEAERAASEEIAQVRDRLRQALAEAEAARRDPAQLLRALHEVSATEREMEVRRRAPDRARRSGPQEAPAPRRPLRKGDLVAVASLDQEGEVIAAPDGGEADVQVGSFKLRVPLGELRLLPRRAPDVARTTVHLEQRDAVPSQIEVRGWRAEDVPPVVDKYIHDAYLAGVPSVRIVHGKGTGVLRRLVREQLSSNPLVRSMRQPEPREGGEGVTVVELAN